MADHSGIMTLARAQIVALRLQGLTLAALVERGVLQRTEAAELVREAATMLQSPHNDPVVEKSMQDAYELLASDLEQHPPR